MVCLMKSFFLNSIILISIAILETSCVAQSPTRTSPTPTLTLLPTRTLFISPPVSSMSLPQPTPTLSREERDSQILNLLMTNAGCELPCWWGIVPGETTLDQTREYIRSLGRELIPPQPSWKLRYYDGGVDLSKPLMHIHFQFLEQDGVVIATHVNIDHIGLDLSTLYQYWNSYSPSAIMHKYGQPERVWLEIGAMCAAGCGGISHYDLFLFYDHQGILIIYHGKTSIQEGYRICPEFNKEAGQVNGIDIFLSSDMNQAPLEQLVDISEGRIPFIFPLEQVSTLSIQGFYELFTQADSNPCIETSREKWLP